MKSLFLLLALQSSEDPLADRCKKFSPYDSNGDGIAEIASLAPIEGRSGGEKAPLLLVLVEARLLADESLLPSLRRYAEDLVADGWDPRLVSAHLYSGDRHQDGRTLLAVREFLRAVRDARPNLRGAVLVGSFPEALLVRMYNWRKKGPLTLHKGKANERKFETPVDFVSTAPEIVAHRCELILADLDGRWEDLYREERQRVPTLLAAFPGVVPPKGGISTDFEVGSRSFEDFFFVNDGRYETSEILGPQSETVALRFQPLDELQDSEGSAEDLRRKNPIARPDIVVSRINARGIALKPRGELLDSSGKPQRAKFADAPKDLWEPDPTLERRLLVEYFERNHRFRQGEFAKQFLPASVAFKLGSGRGAVTRASGEWIGEGHHLPKASVLDLVEWLRRPAVLRDVRAHSDRAGSVFDKADAERILTACGSTPWDWTRKGDEYVPSLDRSAKGKADFVLYRTLWENRVLPDGASFYYHTGCESISPQHAEDRPYNHSEYGRKQGAESILFYAQGLALVGRSKVFYDAPRGFYEALAEGRTFGEAWARYFEIESEAKSAEEVGGGIGRKRTYFWSVLGDWTLRLRPSSR